MTGESDFLVIGAGIAAALARDEAFPADIEALGCTAADLGPRRINPPEGG